MKKEPTEAHAVLTICGAQVFLQSGETFVLRQMITLMKLFSASRSSGQRTVRASISRHASHVGGWQLAPAPSVGEEEPLLPQPALPRNTVTVARSIARGSRMRAAPFRSFDLGTIIGEGERERHAAVRPRPRLARARQRRCWSPSLRA